MDKTNPNTVVNHSVQKHLLCSGKSPSPLLAFIGKHLLTDQLIQGVM